VLWLSELGASRALAVDRVVGRLPLVVCGRELRDAQWTQCQIAHMGLYLHYAGSAP